MLINEQEVLLQTFNIKTSISAKKFVNSAGREEFRVRTNNPVTWDAEINLNFADNQDARCFSDSVSGLSSYAVVLDEPIDVNFIAPEATFTSGINIYVKGDPIIKATNSAKTNVILNVTLDKVGVVPPGSFDANIIFDIPYEWDYADTDLYVRNFNETYEGTQRETSNLVKGRTATFNYTLTYDEYVEMRKFVLWGVRYDDFTWQGIMGTFPIGSTVRIKRYRFSYSGRQIYKVSLDIEEQ